MNYPSISIGDKVRVVNNPEIESRAMRGKTGTVIALTPYREPDQRPYGYQIVSYDLLESVPSYSLAVGAPWSSWNLDLEVVE